MEASKKKNEMESHCILVINAGSSSLKFELFKMADTPQRLAKGLVERIGLSDPYVTIKRYDGQELKGVEPVKNHIDALNLVCQKLIENQSSVGVLKSLSEVQAIGHRVVHGGEHFHDSAIITPEVKKAISDCIPLAPLHNPPNLMGIEACEKTFQGVPNVAVFDTAFHHSMPPASHLYAMPLQYYKDYGIRKYGFHGTSHKYVAESTAKFLGKDITDFNLITCHLGNGSSIAAIDHGKVIDTSMGMTPLPGLVMGSRSGDIDPAIIFYLIRKGIKPDDIDNLLNKKSGLLGLANINSGDMRDILNASHNGNEQASMALQIFAQRLAFYIGAYYTLLNGADAIVFTGGIGENSPPARELIVQKLKVLGCILDQKKNQAAGQATIISTTESKIKAVVMPTNEELMIAKDTLRLFLSQIKQH